MEGYFLTWWGVKDGSSMYDQEQDSGGTRARLVGRGMGRGRGGGGLHAAPQHSTVTLRCHPRYEGWWENAVCVRERERECYLWGENAAHLE